MNLTMITRSRDEAGVVRTILGIASLAVFFIAMLAVIVLLTFSVKVYGGSMEPTLHDGDRMLTNIFGRGSVDRFDLVQASAGENGIEVVKRVIGLPGDAVMIRPGTVEQPPVVLVRPDAGRETYRVDNSAWTGRYGSRLNGCCDPKGNSVTGRGRWLTLGEDSYWLLGDNWGESDDSRVWGTITSDEISSTLNFRLMPLGDLGPVDHDVELVPLTR